MPQMVSHEHTLSEKRKKSASILFFILFGGGGGNLAIKKRRVGEFHYIAILQVRGVVAVWPII